MCVFFDVTSLIGRVQYQVFGSRGAKEGGLSPPAQSSPSSPFPLLPNSSPHVPPLAQTDDEQCSAVQRSAFCSNNGLNEKCHSAAAAMSYGTGIIQLCFVLLVIGIELIKLSFVSSKTQPLRLLYGTLARLYDFQFAVWITSPRLVSVKYIPDSCLILFMHIFYQFFRDRAVLRIPLHHRQGIGEHHRHTGGKRNRKAPPSVEHGETYPQFARPMGEKIVACDQVVEEVSPTEYVARDERTASLDGQSDQSVPLLEDDFVLSGCADEDFCDTTGEDKQMFGPPSNRVGTAAYPFAQPHIERTISSPTASQETHQTPHQRQHQHYICDCPKTVHSVAVGIPQVEITESCPKDALKGMLDKGSRGLAEVQQAVTKSCIRKLNTYGSCGGMCVWRGEGVCGERGTLP